MGLDKASQTKYCLQLAVQNDNIIVSLWTLKERLQSTFHFPDVDFNDKAIASWNSLLMI